MGTTLGTMHVRRSAFIQATPERVWEEFASFDRLRDWFGIGHTLHAYEPKLGARVELSVELDGTRQRYGGTITVFEPVKSHSNATGTTRRSRGAFRRCGRFASPPPMTARWSRFSITGSSASAKLEVPNWKVTKKAGTTSISRRCG
jgi:hypothetical protein